MGLPPMGPGEATAALAASELKTKEAPDDVAASATKDAMDVSPSADVGGAAPTRIGGTTADAPSKADGNAAFAPVPAGNLPESGGGPRGSAARRKRPRPVDATGGANTADEAPSSPPISSPVAGGGASANAEESTAASRSASQRKDRRRGGHIVRGGYIEYPNGFKMRWAPVLLPPPSPPRRGGRAKRTKPPATTASGDDVDVGDGGGVVAEAAAATAPSPVLASLIDAPTTPDGGHVGGATAGIAVASCDTPPKGTIGRVATGDHPPPPGRDGTAGDDSAGAHPVTYNREHNLSAVFGSSSGGSGGKAAGSPGSASVAAGEGSGRGGVSREVGGGSGGAGSAGGDGHPTGVTGAGVAGAVGAAGVVGAGAAGAGSASPLVASSRPSVGDEQPVAGEGVSGSPSRTPSPLPVAGMPGDSDDSSVQRGMDVLGSSEGESEGDGSDPIYGGDRHFPAGSVTSDADDEGDEGDVVVAADGGGGGDVDDDDVDDGDDGDDGDAGTRDSPMTRAQPPSPAVGSGKPSSKRARTARRRSSSYPAAAVGNVGDGDGDESGAEVVAADVVHPTAAPTAPANVHFGGSAPTSAKRLRDDGRRVARRRERRASAATATAASADTVAVRPNRGRKDPPNGRRVVGSSDPSDGDGLLHSVEALRRLLTLLRKQPPKHKAGVTPQWVATAAAATGFPADVVGAYLAAAATELAALAAPGSGGSPVPPGAARLAAYVAADLFHARLRRAAAAAEVLALPDSAESGEEVRSGGDAVGGDFFDAGADGGGTTAADASGAPSDNSDGSADDDRLQGARRPRRDLRLTRVSGRTDSDSGGDGGGSASASDGGSPGYRNRGGRGHGRGSGSCSGGRGGRATTRGRGSGGSGSDGGGRRRGGGGVGGGNESGGDSGSDSGANRRRGRRRGRRSATPSALPGVRIPMNGGSGGGTVIVPRVEVDTVRLHVERQAEVLAAREVASARSAWQQDLSDVRARLTSEATEMTALDAERERADGVLRSARAAGEREAAACDGVEDELRAARFHELDARRRLDRARLKLAAMRGHVDVATVDALAVGDCGDPVDGSDVHGNVPAAVDTDDELAADELLQEPTELSQLRSLAAMLTSEVADWGVHATEEARRCRLLTATLVRLEEEVARSRATQGSAGGLVGPGGGGGVAALGMASGGGGGGGGPAGGSGGGPTGGAGGAGAAPPPGRAGGGGAANGRFVAKGGRGGGGKSAPSAAASSRAKRAAAAAEAAATAAAEAAATAAAEAAERGPSTSRRKSRPVRSAIC